MSAGKQTTNGTNLHLVGYLYNEEREAAVTPDQSSRKEYAAEYLSHSVYLIGGGIEYRSLDHIGEGRFSGSLTLLIMPGEYARHSITHRGRGLFHVRLAGRFLRSSGCE
jgi:hypothetical protein|uniref:Uncharacterized protein n=1 Tax=Picea glauca TaxID=3330 RepID=A0A101M269_PICGL|nr:hypothetical protein ABT39_MTgene2740 [Picea glauca]QHR90517.1 hypothetical protein Q903MT_gene4542 [Picea sitchensis]